MSKVRRGVHMVATARKPKAHWREEADDSGDEQLPDEEREASRLDWDTLENEVEGERRKVRQAEDFASGRRGTGVVDYEDIDDEVARAEAAEAARVAELSRVENVRREAEELAAAEEAQTEEAAVVGGAVSGCARGPAEVDSDDDERPGGAVTAGQVEKEKKRAGKNKTGSSKRRLREKEEEAEANKKKKRKDDDANRWMKLKLKGDEKPKKIDATRIVHYHDYDGDPLEAVGGVSDVAVPAAATAGGASEAGSSSGGNFRARLRRDLWEDDDD